ncbi:hypothetical protein ASC66_09195 [Leifsonia sp. Root4]|uniref:hypothetical protein n=1 Tax=Leifsonia sp. Root4 TaxID=1736525 RepID=UPI0006FC17A2|nr:hypothetical protein [Leifsonia sp. Root4]KQW06627.1 hypothetical protein ASC66_09195 [Leifsonia sp. Root4]
MDEHLRNPAGRLWLFLSYAHQHAAHGRSMLELWAQYLDVAPEPNAEFFSGVAELLALPGQVREAVNGLQNPLVPHELLLSGLTDAEPAMARSANLTSGSGEFAGMVPATALVMLETCSHMLNNSGLSDAEIPLDSLAEMRSLAEELLRTVEDADGLDSGVRRIIFEYATAILRAIGLLRVTGVGAVLLEHDRMTGRVVRDLGLREALVQRPRFFDAIVRLGQVINALVQVRQGTQAIGSDLADILALGQLPVELAAPAEETQRA